jgi:transcriptional regulator with XRE-family HTH domain
MEQIELRFANAVKKRRKELGMSQETFAEEAGIHRTYASSIERGKVQVSLVVASQIAQALKLKLSELLARTESEKGAR